MFVSNKSSFLVCATKIVLFSLLPLISIHANVSNAVHAKTNRNQQTHYSYFVGKIGDKPAILQLVQYADRFCGSLYFTGTQELEQIIDGKKIANNRALHTAGKYVYDNKKPGYTQRAHERYTLKGTISNGLFVGNYEKTIDDKPVPNTLEKFSFKQNKKQSAFFDAFFIKNQKRLLADKDYPLAYFSAGILWPTKKCPQAHFLRSELHAFFSTASTGTPSTMFLGALTEPWSHTAEEKPVLLANAAKLNSPLTFLRTMRDQFFKNYLLLTEELWNIDEKDWYSTVYVREQDAILFPGLWSKQLCNFCLETLIYQGGCHHDIQHIWVNFDLINNRKITLSDLINDRGMDLLPYIIEESFYIQSQLDESTTISNFIGVNTPIKPVNNFCLTPGYITFCYNPYEIACYATGGISITVPLSFLKEYMTDYAVKLLY